MSWPHGRAGSTDEAAFLVPGASHSVHSQRTTQRPAPETLRDGFMSFWPDHLRSGSQPGPSASTGRRRALLLSYLPDWLASLAFLAIFSVLEGVDGFKREFDLNDSAIQHTFAVRERVPFWLCVTLAYVVPIGIICFVALTLRRSFWDLHNGLLGLLLSASTTMVVTDAIKVTVGRPRPDLIDRCQPTAGAVNAAIYGLSNVNICTQRNARILREGFRSFISGHSSSAFSGLTFLSLYLAGKLHLFDGQGHSLKFWIALSPLVGAILIAISRTMDYRHHATDVLAGGLVGFLLACFAYFQYYPLLSSPICHLPYEPRIVTSTWAFEQLSADRQGATLDQGFSNPDIGTAPRTSEEQAKAVDVGLV